MVVIKLYFKSIDLRLLPNIPGKKSDAFAEPADIILSLVETTFLGFRIFSQGILGQKEKLWSHLKEASPSQPSLSMTVADLIQSLTCEVGVLFFDISFIVTA